MSTTNAPHQPFSSHSLESFDNNANKMNQQAEVNKKTSGKSTAIVKSVSTATESKENVPTTNKAKTVVHEAGKPVTSPDLPFSQRLINASPAVAPAPAPTAVEGDGNLIRRTVSEAEPQQVPESGNESTTTSNNPDNSDAQVTPLLNETETPSIAGTSSLPIVTGSTAYWNHVLASKPGETPEQAIDRHMVALEKAETDSWKDLMVGAVAFMDDEDKKQAIANISAYVTTALVITKEEMNNGRSWLDCCNEAAHFLSDADGMNMGVVVDGELVKEWFSLFRHIHKFTLHELPSFFLESPEIHRRIAAGEKWDAIVSDQIKQLKEPGDWKNLLVNAEANNEVGVFCGPLEKQRVISKALYVMYTLRAGRASMPYKSWDECCLKGVASTNNLPPGAVDIKCVHSPQTITLYYRDFVENNGKFSLIDCQEKKVVSALLCNDAFFEKEEEKQPAAEKAENAEKQEGEKPVVVTSGSI